MYYGFKFIVNKLKNHESVPAVLEKNSIPKIKLDKSINHPESIDKIKRFEPDLMVSILGNEIFKKPVIEIASGGCLNLHTSLLPKYRGIMPTFWV